MDEGLDLMVHLAPRAVPPLEEQIKGPGGAGMAHEPALSPGGLQRGLADSVGGEVRVGWGGGGSRR